MFSRYILPQLLEEIQNSPAVALLGPRQSGKTTLALEAAKSIPSIYLDLESERDRAKLAQPELYLSDHLDKLVILDEVHRAPSLFPVLRGLIDQARRAGKRAGQYLLRAPHRLICFSNRAKRWQGALRTWSWGRSAYRKRAMR